MKKAIAMLFAILGIVCWWFSEIILEGFLLVMREAPASLLAVLCFFICACLWTED